MESISKTALQGATRNTQDGAEAAGMPTADGQRDRRGQFVQGNTASKGVASPDARKAAEWRHSFRDAVSADDVMQVVVALVKAAKAGEPWAVRDLLDRTVGPSGKLDLAIGAGGGVQVLIVPAGGLQSMKPQDGPGYDTIDDGASGAVVEVCEPIATIDASGDTACGHGSGPARADSAHDSDAEEGGDDDR